MIGSSFLLSEVVGSISFLKLLHCKALSAIVNADCSRANRFSPSRVEPRLASRNHSLRPSPCFPLIGGGRQALIRMIVSAMNHFPLSLLILRLLRPSHAPGGVYLHMLPFVDAADADRSVHSASGSSAGMGASGQARSTRLRASMSMPDMRYSDGPASDPAIPVGWGSAKPSPLRANERRRESLVGRWVQRPYLAPYA